MRGKRTEGWAGRGLTSSLQEEIERLWKEGKSSREIEKAVKVSQGVIVRMARQRHWPEHPERRMPGEVKQQVLDLLRKGKKILEIVRLTGHTPSRVYWIRDKYLLGKTDQGKRKDFYKKPGRPPASPAALAGPPASTLPPLPSELEAQEMVLKNGR